MNILILNPILYTADNNKIPQVNSIKDCMIYTMALGFKNLGHNVTLVASQDYKPASEESYAIEVIFLKSRFTNFFLPSVLPFSPALWKYLRKRKNDFDLIISSETFSFSSLFASLLVPKKAVIWQELTAHNNKFRKIPSKIWYNLIAKMFMQPVLVIPRSPVAKQFISRYMKRVSGDWVDHGVNLEKFNSSSIKKTNFIVVSQLIPRKNVSSIISIFEKFLRKWPMHKDFKLLIAGRGEEESLLKKMVSDLNLENNVIFLGFLKHAELNRYISESQAILFNTRRDLNIVSIPEAIVSGTPVITNEISTLASYINKKQIGIAKNNWDEDNLKEIIKNNVQYVNNCLSVRNEMSKESAARKIIGLYEAGTKDVQSIVAG